MKYLIQIVRGTRLERPTETQIQSDSTNANIGNFGAVSQTASTDNYFILHGDLQKNMDRLNAIQDSNPYKPNYSIGEGFRIIEYPYGGGTGRTTQEVYNGEDEEGNPIVTYEEFYVRYSGDPIAPDVKSERHFSGENGLDDANEFCDTLEVSEQKRGFDLISKKPGPSEVIRSRPKMDIDSEEEVLRGVKALNGRGSEADVY